MFVRSSPRITVRIAASCRGRAGLEGLEKLCTRIYVLLLVFAVPPELSYLESLNCYLFVIEFVKRRVLRRANFIASSTTRFARDISASTADGTEIIWPICFCKHSRSDYNILRMGLETARITARI